MKAPGLKQNIFPTSIAAQNSVKTVIEKSGLSLDLGTSSVQLARLYNTDHLDLKIGKTNMRAEAALCVFFLSFGKESVLTTLVREKPVGLSAGKTNIDLKKQYFNVQNV